MASQRPGRNAAQCLPARGTPGPGLWVSLVLTLGIKQFKQK